MPHTPDFDWGNPADRETFVHGRAFSSSIVTQMRKGDGRVGIPNLGGGESAQAFTTRSRLKGGCRLRVPPVCLRGLSGTLTLTLSQYRNWEDGTDTRNRT